MRTNLLNKLAAYCPPHFLCGRLLAQMTLAYIAGLLLAAFSSVPAAITGVLALGLFACAALCLWRYRKAATALLLIAMTALGCFLYVRVGAQSASFPVPPGEEAQIYGRVKAESVSSGEGRYRLTLDVREVDGTPWRGQIYLYYEGGPLLPGNYVAARGKVMSFTPYGNPGAFDYGAYMKRQGIAAALSCYYDGEIRSLSGFVTERSSVRGRLLTAFDAVAGENAALLKGVFLGDKSDLSFAQKSALSFSGVLHAFAVSGLHVGYLVAAALMVAGAGRKRRWPRLVLTAAMLLFYLRLTGSPASILRAAMMALCLLAAGALDEKNDPYTALSLAALLCLVYKPLWILDAGFQLSFAAAFGLLYLRPAMLLLLSGGQPAVLGPHPWLGQAKLVLSEIFAVTMAASFGTMPLIGYYFCHISIVGWLVSPLFVVGAGLTVVCCFAAALLSVFAVLPATLPVYATDFLMRALYNISAASSSLPGAYIASGHTPLAAVLLFYTALLALPIWAKKRRKPRRFLLLALILLIVLLAFSPALGQAANGQLEVVFLDVGQGDAALLVTPAGKTILIDGGGNRLNSGSVGENALMPYLRYRGISRIDVMISSHPDADHIDGLFTVLENMPVRQLLYADCFPDSELQQYLLALARQNGVALTPAYAGMRFAVEPGLTLEICHPSAGAAYAESASNDGSLTVLISYGEVGVLFTGDVNLARLARIPAANIVKLPHHGSKNNYDEAAYQQLDAAAVVLSVGRDNSYGHPAPIVVEYWQDKAAVYRTDRHGAVTITSNGHTWQADTYWEFEK